jgi:hypothetical protein
MPWTVKDVDEHKKGLTPAQKAKWVSVANGVYADCMKNGGSDATCAPKAIRVANSKFEEESRFVNKEIASIPLPALDLTDIHGFAKVSFAEGDNKEKPTPRMDIVCYSGQVIKGHWFWGDLVIDTQGMEFPKKKYPILEAHDTERKIAFIEGKPTITPECVLTVNPENVKFMDTPFAEEFIRLSQEGFPYEASIRAYPSKIQVLQGSEESEVNGFKMKGPGTIWRKSTFKEVSVCVFGYDDKTSAKVFSDPNQPHVDLDVEMEFAIEAIGKTALQCFSGKYCIDKTKQTDKNVGDPKGKGEGKKMTLDELKKEHPDLVTELSKEVEAKFSQEKDSLVTDFTTKLQATNDKLNTLAETNKSLEKQLSIRAEKDRQTEAAAIMETQLFKSKIPNTLHDKVRRQISYTAFVKDDVLDVAAFTKAVEDEIKDWEDRIGDKVLGFGTASKTSTEKVPSPDELSEDDQRWVDKMVGMTGK